MGAHRPAAPAAAPGAAYDPDSDPHGQTELAADPAAREAAAGLLPPPVLVHAVLLRRALGAAPAPAWL